MSSTTTKPDTADKSSVPEKDAIFGFECLRNIRDGKVDLVAVAQALQYTNVDSVSNRFRALRKKYGFSGLEGTATSANANAGSVRVSPSKRKAAVATTDGDNSKDNDENDENSAAPPTKRAGRVTKGATRGAGRGRKKDPTADAVPVETGDDTGGCAGEGAQPGANSVVGAEYHETA
ncbi:hypothetical protein BDW68DRAFT_177121 [Aspergillus falconensis]